MFHLQWVQNDKSLIKSIVTKQIVLIKKLFVKNVRIQDKLLILSYQRC